MKVFTIEDNWINMRTWTILGRLDQEISFRDLFMSSLSRWKRRKINREDPVRLWNRVWRREGKEKILILDLAILQKETIFLKSGQAQTAQTSPKPNIKSNKNPRFWPHMARTPCQVKITPKTSTLRAQRNWTSLAISKTAKILQHYL